jgi:hypothetical protein
MKIVKKLRNMAALNAWNNSIKNVGLENKFL